MAVAASGMTLGAERLPYRVRDVLGLADGPRVALPSGPGAEVLPGRLGSGAGFSIAVPPAERGTPRVCLVLHGRDDDHTTAFGSHELDRFLAEAVRAGTPPFALVSVDGGADSYWHRRRDGHDPHAVLDELLAELASRGYPVDRFAVAGWSMGGYGALLAATRYARRVVAVTASSPALFRRFADARPGAFDDEADHRAHDVFSRTRELGDVVVRLSCGRDDPFVDVTRELGEALPRAELVIAPGGHTVAFWQSQALAELRLVGRELARA